jgi:hypothetical protein
MYGCSFASGSGGLEELSESVFSFVNRRPSEEKRALVGFAAASEPRVLLRALRGGGRRGPVASVAGRGPRGLRGPVGRAERGASLRGPRGRSSVGRGRAPGESGALKWVMRRAGRVMLLAAAGASAAAAVARPRRNMVRRSMVGVVGRVVRTPEALWWWVENVGVTWVGGEGRVSLQHGMSLASDLAGELMGMVQLGPKMRRDICKWFSSLCDLAAVEEVGVFCSGKSYWMPSLAFHAFWYFEDLEHQFSSSIFFAPRKKKRLININSRSKTFVCFCVVVSGEVHVRLPRNQLHRLLAYDPFFFLSSSRPNTPLLLTLAISTTPLRNL